MTKTQMQKRNVANSLRKRSPPQGPDLRMQIYSKIPVWVKLNSLKGGLKKVRLPFISYISTWL